MWSRRLVVDINVPNEVSMIKLNEKLNSLQVSLEDKIQSTIINVYEGVTGVTPEVKIEKGK